MAVCTECSLSQAALPFPAEITYVQKRIKTHGDTQTCISS